MSVNEHYHIWGHSRFPRWFGFRVLILASLTRSVCVPQTSGGVLEDGRPLRLPGPGMFCGVSPPTRMRDDDLISQGLETVVDDHHLQGFVG